MILANNSIWHFVITGIIITAIVNSFVLVVTALCNMIVTLVKGHQPIINNNYIIDKNIKFDGDSDGKEKG